MGSELRTFETTLEPDGRITMPMVIDGPVRVVVTLMEQEPDEEVTPEILEAIKESELNHAAGNTEAYSSLDEVMSELRANA